MTRFSDQAHLEETEKWDENNYNRYRIWAREQRELTLELTATLKAVEDSIVSTRLADRERVRAALQKVDKHGR